MDVCNWFINRINWNSILFYTYCFSKLRGGGLHVNNFTTSHYEALFTMGSPGLEALWNSFFSLVTAIIAVMIGVFWHL